MMAAGDTFRAAAIEQLGVWAERAGASFVARKAGGDAAGLAFEALEKAQAAGCRHSTDRYRGALAEQGRT